MEKNVIINIKRPNLHESMIILFLRNLKKIFSDAVKDRFIQLEEEKLKIMKEQLSIEKKKLCILEDYVAWRKQQGHSPSVSPVIKGLIEF